jgi:hypothetical protein
MNGEVMPVKFNVGVMFKRFYNLRQIQFKQLQQIVVLDIAGRHKQKWLYRFWWEFEYFDNVTFARTPECVARVTSMVRT